MYHKAVGTGLARRARLVPRALYLAREALRGGQGLGSGKAWVCEGVGFDQLIDAQGYAALSLRRSHLRYAWILDRSKGGDSRPGVWCWSARGLEWCGDC
jgi:hypothetical protein